MGNFDWVYLVYGKSYDLLWQFKYAIGQIFIVINGSMLTKLSSHLVTLVII